MKSTLKTEPVSRFWSGRALEDDWETCSVGENGSCLATRGITPSFGCRGGCPNLANNSFEITLDTGRRKGLGFGSWQRAFPGAGLVLGKGASDPELEVSQVGQLPPVFFVLQVWGLEASQHQSLFTETNKMFDIKALVVSSVDVQQAERVAFLSHDEQPERL